MKRILLWALTLAMALSLCACEEEHETPLTITKKGENVEILTFDRLMEIHEKEEKDYYEDYMGHKVVVEGKVAKIEQKRETLIGDVETDMVIVTLCEDKSVNNVKFMLEKESCDVDFDALSPGTKVRVAGTIGRSRISIEIDRVHDFEIISE